MPPRDARPTKMYARTMRNGLVPKMSSRSEKNRFAGRAPVQPLTSSKTPASAARYAACSFRRRGSPGPGDSLNGLEILRVRLEVLPHGRELAVHAHSDACLQVLRMQLPVRVCLREIAKRLVDDIAPELRIPRDHQLPATRDEDQARNLEDRIADRLSRGAERFADLPLDFARAVVQKDARVRSGFRHLPRDEVHATAPVEGGQERRMEGDDLFPPELRGHVAVQHVRVPLVHAAEREVQIPPELVVDVRMPIREEDDRMKAGAREVSDLRSDHEGGADVHQPGRLESHVRPRGGGPIEERPQFVARDDFLGAAQDGLESVLRGHKPPNLRKRDKGFNPGTGRAAAIRQWP